MGRGATFGEQLRHLREVAGFSQDELASRAGLTAKGIGLLERGARDAGYGAALAPGTPAAPGHLRTSAGSGGRSRQIAGRRAPLTVLATSRAPLRLSGEREWAVAPLDTSASGGADAPETAPAMQLLLARARDVVPGFALTKATAEALAGICRRLDGLPLALELASPWLKLLTSAALLARLDAALPLLTSGARDLPARGIGRCAIPWPEAAFAETLDTRETSIATQSG